MSEYLRRLCKSISGEFSDYAWIIDSDLLWEEGDEGGSDAGVTGPSYAPADLLERLEADPEAGQRFRMYDDDNNLYYEGRYLEGDNADERAVRDEFGPLSDFGAPNAGCTSIHYFNPTTGEWTEL